MNVKNQLGQPLTARLQLHNDHNLTKVKYGTHNSKRLTTNAKLTYNDCMDSISPWGMDQFVSQVKKQVKVNCKSRPKVKSFRNDNLIKQRQIPLYSKPITIDMDDSKIRQQVRKKRSKTEIFKSDVILNRVKLMVNTLEITQSFQNNQNKNQKYFSQDHKQRKMSLNKLRQTFLQTSRSKCLNASSLNKKIQERKIFYQSKSVHNNKDNQLKNPEGGGHRLKTAQMQNDNPLMFFFEVKNSKNMMQRQKNIMKIRKIAHGKSKRINTDGLA